MKRSLKKNNSFSLKQEYANCFNYIKESKKFIYCIFGILFFFALLGGFFPVPESIYSQLINYFKNLVEQTSGYSSIKLILFLFKNNVFASFMGTIFGISFGAFSLFNAMVNGFVLGFAIKLSVLESGILSLWKLLPHGIFELPALFISLGIGLRLGAKFLEKQWKVKTVKKQIIMMFIIGIVFSFIFGFLFLYFNEWSFLFLLLFFVIPLYYFTINKKLREELILALKCFILVVVPLLVVSAIIEGMLIFLMR